VTEELNAFLRTHRIVNVEKKLIDSERGTGWVFLVEYATENSGGLSGKSGGNSRLDYRELLSPEEYALFDRLRVCRKDLAEKAGLPVYTIFTNDQLAGMVKKPPRTEKDLLAIAGVGESRVKQYGETFLRFFRAEFEEKKPPPPEA
jgi:superfamily II DNA helicase RecQ